MEAAFFMGSPAAVYHKAAKNRFFRKISVTPFTLCPHPCLYTATHRLSPFRDSEPTDRTMIKNYDETPLSQSNVSLKLADIQKRCSELIEDQDGLGSLTLEEPVADTDNSNPYNRG